MIKARPKIRVRIPTEIRPGDDFVAVVMLECRRDVDVEHVDALLEGVESWSVGSGDSRVSRRQELVRLGARLSGARTLEAGKTELPVRIPLPRQLPASFRGSNTHIEYELRVHVSIDWWPDARAAFEIKVVPPHVESPPTNTAVYASDPEGPREREPHVELSLASTWTRAGGVVSGALALSNVAHNRYTHVQVGLRGIEMLYGASSVRQREYMRYQIRLGVEQAAEGEMIPFSFRLPEDAMPEYAAGPRPDGKRGLSALEWQLELTAGIQWAGDLTVRVPFRVLPASARPGDAPLRLAPPTVGSDRLRAIWEAAGAPHGLRYEAQSLSARVGQTQVMIRREHMGRGGIYVVAELRYPELHLDLVVERASKLRKLVGGDVQIGEPRWDREHYVVARDEAQSREVLRALVPALIGARLRRFDDRALLIELRDSGMSGARLERFAAAVVQLARRFEQVRRDLPPPAVMRPALEAWRALAQKLGGRLESARMRIEGQLGAHGAEVRLTFDAAGQPSTTWLSIVPSGPLDDEHGFRWRAQDGPASDRIAPRWTGQLGELAAICCADACELSIETERIAVCFPSPLGIASGEGRVIEVAAAERRLERMAQLATLLRGHAGPYR